MNIYQKLQKARVLLQEKNLKKSGENKFSNFKYYELADFLPAVNAIFNEVGLSSVFNLTDKAILTIINSEKTDEIQQFVSPIAEVQLKGCTDVQALGAVHTYMKRYLYLNALEIVENDFLDGNAGNKEVISDKPVEKKEVETDKPICPICGKPTNQKALNVWGCCSTCKAKQVKESKEKVETL